MPLSHPFNQRLQTGQSNLGLQILELYELPNYWLTAIQGRRFAWCATLTPWSKSRGMFPKKVVVQLVLQHHIVLCRIYLRPVFFDAALMCRI